MAKPQVVLYKKNPFNGKDYFFKKRAISKIILFSQCFVITTYNILAFLVTAQIIY